MTYGDFPQGQPGAVSKALALLGLVTKVKVTQPNPPDASFEMPGIPTNRVVLPNSDAGLDLQPPTLERDAQELAREGSAVLDEMVESPLFVGIPLSRNCQGVWHQGRQWRR